MAEQDILTRLRQRRDELSAAIATIERELQLPTSATAKGKANPSVAQANGTAPDGSGAMEVHTGAFLGISTPKAIVKYLGMVKKAQSPRQIADALMAGGQVHAPDPQTAYVNAYSALKRMKNDKVAKTQNGDWGLIEWYGGRPPKAKAKDED
jgi:hypothetical protein